MHGNHELRPHKGLFQNTKETHFGTEVRQRVDAYFSEKQLSPNWNTPMKWKVGFLLSAYVLSVVSLFVFGNDFLGSIPTLLVIGFLTACIGFNVGHDATHGSLSSSRLVNQLFRHAFELVGASSYTWNLSHNIVHHTYTNIIGIDRDLNSVSALRFFPKPNPRPFHRFQHLYCSILYCFTSFIWVIKKDFSQISEKSLKKWTSGSHPPSAYLTLAISKGLHFSVFLFLPVFVLDWSIWQALLGFVLMHSVAGFMLAIVFQLAHVVEGPDLIQPATPIQTPWADHQMATTSNFSKCHPIIDWICGGLNFQIEHHLFPKVCHIHYRNLAPIVEKTALEFGIPYYDQKTFRKALRSHYRLMKRFGTEMPVFNSY